MLYTSGTTGRPKGVPRSHRADRAGAWSQALQHGYGWGDRTLGVMPLYHTMGDPLAARDAPRRRLLRPAGALGCRRGARADRGAAADLPLPGADALPRPRPPPRPRAPRPLVRARARLRGRRDVVEPRPALRRGLPAARSSSTTTARPRSTRSRSGGISERSRAAPAGPRSTRGCASTDDGEIAVHLSSDEAFGGYWNRPDADEKAIRDGWYHTGDTGRIDEDGDLWIQGRVDDMIVSGGENIHPLEVEDVLAGHPGVREVAVVGAPDDRLGHRVVAVVVGTATEEELDAHCLGSVARPLQASSRVPLRRLAAQEPVGKDPAPAASRPGGEGVTDTHGLLLSRDEENGVATITLSAPEKLNRVTMAARDRLRELFEELGRDESVRAIILPWRGTRLHRRRRHPGLPGRFAGGGLAARLERRGTRAVPEARDRAAARLRIRRRLRARARLRLPDRRGRNRARPARAQPRHDPRQRRHPAAGAARRARTREGHHHAPPAGRYGRGAWRSGS